VTLDGTDVRELDLKWLRSQMAIVSQEPMLFHGTVSENIRYGNPAASDEQVRPAARIHRAFIPPSYSLHTAFIQPSYSLHTAFIEP
jgi:ABC-type multidrug transport system fused ATPase/permease subunit